MSFAPQNSIRRRSNKLRLATDAPVGPPFSLRLGHRTALALSTQFTTVLPLRYLTRESNPSDLFKTGDVIEVKIKDVDIKKHRISLTRKGMNSNK